MTMSQPGYLDTPELIQGHIRDIDIEDDIIGHGHTLQAIDKFQYYGGGSIIMPGQLAHQ